MILDRLTYRYPGNPDFCLGPLQVEGPDRRIWLILGGTGSGKSTLLRLLGGVLKPDAGRVIGVSPFQEAAYLPQLPERALVGRNLAEDLCGEVRPDPGLRTRLRKALRTAGLEGVPLSRRGSTLSSGEKRRVALALLLLTEVRYWALDEPESALDARGTGQMTNLIADRATQSAGATWIATHRFEAYADLDPWALVLGHGEAIAQGKLRDVLRLPRVRSVLSLSERPAFRLWENLGFGTADPLSPDPGSPSRNRGLREREIKRLLLVRMGFG